MTNLLVRGLDEATLARLKARAKAHQRSLQGEAKLILEAAAETMTVLEARQRARDWQAHWGDKVFPDSTADIRADRQR